MTSWSFRQATIWKTYTLESFQWNSNCSSKKDLCRRKLALKSKTKRTKTPQTSQTAIYMANIIIIKRCLLVAWSDLVLSPDLRFANSPKFSHLYRRWIMKKRVPPAFLREKWNQYHKPAISNLPLQKFLRKNGILLTLLRNWMNFTIGIRRISHRLANKSWHLEKLTSCGKITRRPMAKMPAPTSNPWPPRSKPRF